MFFLKLLTNVRMSQWFIFSTLLSQLIFTMLITYYFISLIESLNKALFYSGTLLATHHPKQYNSCGLFMDCLVKST